MSKDLYRRVRRLQRRGPLSWRVHVREPFRISELYDERGQEVSCQVPTSLAPKVQRALASGRPVLLRLYRLNKKGEPMMTGGLRRGNWTIARRLEWIRFQTTRAKKAYLDACQASCQAVCEFSCQAAAEYPLVKL